MSAGDHRRRRLQLAIAAALSAVALWLSLASVFQRTADYRPRTGDLIFQVETGGPSHLIQIATLSPFNHVGIVSAAESPPVVFEALGTVRKTTLGRFIDRPSSFAHRYRVMRLRTPLSPARADALLAEARRYLGRRYDVSLSWSDAEMNCSEYAWKAFARGAGVELSRPRRVGDHPIALLVAPDTAAEMLEEKGQRFAARAVRAIDPDQPFVSPGDLSRSDALEIAWTNLPFESTHHRPIVTLAAWGLAVVALVVAWRSRRPSQRVPGDGPGGPPEKSSPISG
jgi:hypothetical protein